MNKHSVLRGCGNLIKKQREQNGLSVSELARKIGISVKKLEAYEANTVGPKVPTLVKIAKALEIEEKDFLNECWQTACSPLATADPSYEEHAIDLLEQAEQLPVYRGRVSHVVVYEVTETELEDLQAGSNSVLLTFATTLLSIGSSFLIVLLTVQINNSTKTASFVAVTFSAFALGTVLLVLWWRSSRHLENIVHKIKQRVPEGKSSLS